MEFPGGIPALAEHPVGQYDLVLRVLRHDDPEVVIRDFSNRPAANAALKESTQK